MAGKKYYFVQVNGEIESALYVGTPLQKEMTKLGNHFKTRRAAKMGQLKMWNAFRLFRTSKLK